MKKFLKEPLVHFLFIGALIFVVFFMVNDEERSFGDKKIIISSEDINRLSNNWAGKWQRRPSEAELKGLIDLYIKEEIYYREALALGLDQNDTILRRRMMQKMEFLSNDLVDLRQPDEKELNNYFISNQQKYLLPARISFTHIYFSQEKRGNEVFNDAKRVLKELKQSNSSINRDPDRGDSFMLQYDFELKAPFEITRIFGDEFAQKIFQAGTDNWQGPIQSSYGLHLVKITEKREGSIPDFAAIEDKVRTDYMLEQRQRANREIYEQFKKRYEIIIENAPEQSVTTNTEQEKRSSS